MKDQKVGKLAGTLISKHGSVVLSHKSGTLSRILLSCIHQTLKAEGLLAEGSSMIFHLKPLAFQLPPELRGPSC